MFAGLLSFRFTLIIRKRNPNISPGRPKLQFPRGLVPPRTEIKTPPPFLTLNFSSPICFHFPLPREPPAIWDILPRSSPRFLRSKEPAEEKKPHAQDHKTLRVMPRIRCDIAFRLQSQTRQVPPWPDSPGFGAVFSFYAHSCSVSFLFWTTEGNPIRYVDGANLGFPNPLFSYATQNRLRPRPFTTTRNMREGYRQETNFRFPVVLLLCYFTPLVFRTPNRRIAGCIPHSVTNLSHGTHPAHR